ncbi:MAG TPA: Lrp/AsnC family transcriptional regulator [Devosiaceae bacterium]
MDRSRRPAIASAQFRLDDRDLKILSILQREGRIPKAALAERVNLSATPCWERLKRLEEAGIIEGYGARISLKAFAPLTLVFVQIQLESHHAEDFARFENAIAAMPEIMECWAVGGGIDYFCKVVVKTIEAYQELIDRLLAADIGVDKYYSYVVTNPVKQSPLPIGIVAQPVEVRTVPDI